MDTAGAQPISKAAAAAKIKGIVKRMVVTPFTTG
jgi:hypothetical protein